MDEGSAGPVFTGRDLPRWLAAFPRPRKILLGSMSYVSRHASNGKWSARRTLTFLVVGSTALWAIIIGAGLWIAHLIEG